MTKRGLAHRICPAKRHAAMKMGQRRPARRRQGCRGWKRDHIATQQAGFLDSRSYISLDNHRLLYGEDKSLLRIQVWAAAQGKCGVCGTEAPLNSQEENRGNLRHLENKHNDFRRCDCPEGCMWAHQKTCHMDLDHPGPRLQSIPLVMAERGGNGRPA